ncbi:phosphatidylglycerol lysyltransferase domain-containing protein [Flectobacillus roseus]|uniref:phosphatidylglycerol lysyltransferase domain-containing protein n=1 Tax=Flectobacillus roseus TaxID=502259 RepID=UPI0024B86D77|nr:phosphatidylglycerol lysyltransferase domain-containing protein [Flectobacillus roseus]MDI9871518.1 phosphatidylglycerol lysyltransferase domain-containing protein [Flectobacillus roseus]
MKNLLKSRNYYLKEILAFLFLLLAIYFFRQQQSDIVQSVNVLKNIELSYFSLGLLVTVLYILLNGLMYVYAFRAVQSNITLTDGLKLFLKRNLISVFLPGGGVTSLAFFNQEIERKGVSKTRINFASYIYAVVGIASLALVAFPVLVYLAIVRSSTASSWFAFEGIVVLVALLVWATWSFLEKGWVYKQLTKVSPQFEMLAEEINVGNFSVKEILMVLVFSVGIEITGMLHLGIAMKALGLSASIESCIAGYVIATLFYVISPFLRGLGAVEVSMILLITSYGFSETQAISITLLYRIFEFWLPLVAGIGSFLLNRGNILLRILPAMLLALLGIVNIISVLTPPLVERLQLLENFLPVATVHLSNQAVLMAGISMLICAAFLMRGQRNAWLMAVLLSTVSLVGHLTKAIDYEESIFALFTLIILLFTRKQYYVRSDRKLQSFGLRLASLILGMVLVYGVIGFYFLDKKEFGIDFSLSNSIENSIRSFFLLETTVSPVTRFAKGFIHSINLLGSLSLGLLIYAFVKPYIFHYSSDEEEQAKALDLLAKYGHTADDHFKVDSNKTFYFGTKIEGFIAYKIASGFAIALGEPVCEDSPESMRKLLHEFEVFCKRNSLKTAYYKIDESKLSLFESFGKKSLPIGQEAIVNLQTFTLEGKDKKSLRNALNALEKKGFKTVVHQAPIKDGLLQKLKHVSDDWLRSLNRKEMVFSQGMFNWNELKNQTIITIENSDEKIVSFLNIIPDYTPNEGTYDLVRKTEDAPSGSMDALIIALIAQLKEQGLSALNMGVAPMSGIDQPKDFPEWTVKFAYEKLQQFRHYHGLRDFKDKFNPTWVNKYLVYENHYDLISLPMALGKVMKP